MSNPNRIYNGGFMGFKCYWCNIICTTPISAELKYKDELQKATFCSQEHVENATKFFKYAEVHLIHFILGLVLSGVIGTGLTIIGIEGFGLFVILAGIGITMLIFPFATPQTNQLLGFKNAIRLLRVLSIIIIGIGLILWMFTG